MAPPANTTPELWRFWQEFSAAEPDAILGGIYANKGGYHNTRANLLRTNPSDYSIQRPADKKGPADKAAALDITFRSAHRGNYATIAKYSKRLYAAGTGRDKRFYDSDGQTAIVREFFGNTDSDTEVEGWSWYRERPASSDKSHLWHIHLSITRAYLSDWSKLGPVLDVLLARTETPEEDMPLTTKEIDAIAKRVWTMDGVIPNRGNKTNPFMTGASALSDLEATQDARFSEQDAKLNAQATELRAIRQEVTNLKATIGPMIVTAVEAALKDKVVQVDINVNQGEQPT